MLSVEWSGHSQLLKQSIFINHLSVQAQPRCRLALSLGTDGSCKAAPGQACLLSFPPRATLLSSFHNSTLGVTALFVGHGGGASCQAQWSLNPEVPSTPSGVAPRSSPSRALLAGCLARPHRHALAVAQLPGPWPPATIPS